MYLVYIKNMYKLIKRQPNLKKKWATYLRFFTKEDIGMVNEYIKGL